jgi:hypothetical protein
MEIRFCFLAVFCSENGIIPNDSRTTLTRTTITVLTVFSEVLDVLGFVQNMTAPSSTPGTFEFALII